MAGKVYGKFTTEQLEAILLFDNGLTYTCATHNTYGVGNILVTGSVNENESVDDGNPVGIISSNNASLSIMDKEDKLVSTNSASPYYGYMRNGVKATLTLLKDGTRKPFGTYYTDSWDTNRVAGYYEPTYLTCKDRINYLGNKEIPELPAYSSITIKDLLINIFSALDITDYEISDGLDLQLVYSVKQGVRLKDVLNDIALALVARITCDRTGKILIKPAFPERVEYGVIDESCLVKTSIQHNTSNQYNKVRLDYVSMGVEESVNLASLSNISVASGEQTVNGILLNSDTQGIDQVYLDEDSTPDVYDKVDVEDFKGYQGGVTVYLNNKTAESINVSINVEGRVSSVTNASVYADVLDNDVKVANTLIVESKYIQTEVDALAYVNKIAQFIRSNREILKLNAYIDPSIETGYYYRINSDDVALAGLYYLRTCVPKFSESYICELELVKCV